MVDPKVNEGFPLNVAGLVVGASLFRGCPPNIAVVVIGLVKPKLVVVVVVVAKLKTALGGWAALLCVVPETAAS